MTAGELIEILEQFDPDTIVRFSYDCHDYWHHQIAKQINFVDLGIVEYNSYVEEFCLVSEDNNEDNQEFNAENCTIILR